jgi:glycosyltransferase involved in cell wall biosynthesis
VVNAVGAGSIPAEIGAAVDRTTDVDVDLLTWFGADDPATTHLDVTSLDAPDSTLGIDRATFTEASRRLRDYDLIQAHHNHSGAFAKVLAWRHGIPAVSREGNTRDGFTRKGRLANGLTNPFADRVVCISNSVFQSFTRWERAILDENTVTIIPNGVDLERIDGTDPALPPDVPSNDDAIVVGNAAMLHEQKAHDTLIEAIARVGDRTERPVELVVCGDGPERGSLESLVDRLGLADRVHFLGLVERRRVYEVLHAVDVFSMPSRWEGFCVAVAEAMATRTPTILSGIRTFRELYADAALFHEVDSVGGLVDGLEQLVGQESLRDDLARDGRALVEDRYTLTEVASQYADLYRSIVA